MARHRGDRDVCAEGDAGAQEPRVFQQRWAEVWSVSGEDSEDGSDFSGSEDDENFTVRKSKAKETKRKEVKAKPPAEKKEKPKPKRGAGGKPVPHVTSLQRRAWFP